MTGGLWSLSREGRGTNAACSRLALGPPPGQEPAADPRGAALAAALALVAPRAAGLNPPGASAADLKARTLTNLYTARPTWLAQAHARLAAAVRAAYG